MASDIQCLVSACSNSSCVPLLECTKDIQSHLRLIKQSACRELQYEWQLIAVRAGRFHLRRDHAGLGLGLGVCSAHRASLGIQCRPRTTCQHPVHSGSGKSSVDRTMGPQVVSEIHSGWNILVPVGSGKSCLSAHV